MTAQNINSLKLHQFVCEAFSIPELHEELCLELGIDLENISNAANKKGKVLDLIRWYERRRESDKFVEVCEKLRPNYEWHQTIFNTSLEEENIEQKAPLLNDPGNVDKLISIDSKQTEDKPQDESFETNTERTAQYNRQKNHSNKADNNKNEKQHLEDAEDLAQIALNYHHNHQPVQSRTFARKSAEKFLEANRKLDAIKQYIFAAENYVQNTPFHAGMVLRELDTAFKLAKEIENSYLKAKILLLKTQVSLFIDRVNDAEMFWAEIEELLPAIEFNSDEIAYELAIQKASFLRLNKSFQEALNILETTKNMYNNSSAAYLDLLWVLLFLHSELGKWIEVENIYEDALKILQIIDEPIQSGMWKSHYASSLTREGKLEKAIDFYDKAISLIERGGATPKQKYDLYQNMLFLLNRYGGLQTFRLKYKHDSRRLDLLLNLGKQDLGYEYAAQAIFSQFHDENTQKSFLEANIAFLISWKEGNWFGLNHVNNIFSKLCFLDEKYVDAVITAVYTEHGKAIPKFAPSLLNIQDREEINRLFSELIREWPTWPDQANALMAISECVDILPPNREDELFLFVRNILKQSEQPKFNSKVYAQAIKTLSRLAARLNEQQISETFDICLSILDLENSNIRKEALRLLAEIIPNTTSIETSIEQAAFNILQSLCKIDGYKIDAEAALVNLGLHSSIGIQNQVIEYFQDQRDVHFLAILGVKISEAEIHSFLERVLKSNTPREDKIGGISFGGLRLRSINNLNDVIPESLHDFTIDGLLGVLDNPDGFLNQKGDAIMTLRWLTHEVTRNRTSEISQKLLNIAIGDISSNQYTNLFGGSTKEEIRRNALYALGCFYTFVDESSQKEIQSLIISCGSDTSVPIRLGAAMALRVFEDPLSFSTNLTYTLLSLFSDEDPRVREWAYSAAGHRIADKSISNDASKFLIDRLVKAVNEEPIATARSGAAYALRILVERGIPIKSSEEDIHTARISALEDVNYQVRKKAAGSE